MWEFTRPGPVSRKFRDSRPRPGLWELRKNAPSCVQSRTPCPAWVGASLNASFHLMGPRSAAVRPDCGFEAGIRSGSAL